MKILNEIKTIKQPTAIAIGYFDGLHLGHQAVIRAAVTAAQERGLTPAVFTFNMADARLQAKSGGDILDETDKRKLMAQLGVQIYISPAFEDVAGLTGKAFVNNVLFEQCGAAVICCGADFRFGRDRACGAQELERLCRAAGAQLVVAPAVLDGGLPVSSTRIKAALAAGDMDIAARMLGRPYRLKLIVQPEKRLAGRLGFPTINQRLPEGLAPLRLGVYFAAVTIDAKTFFAVSNVGRRPTAGDGSLVLETHILDYDGQLYGHEVSVELRKFLRDERRFETLEALKHTVERDIAAARTLAAK